MSKEAMKLALEALESLFSGKVDDERGQRCSNAAAALREALAEQPAQQGHSCYCPNCEALSKELAELQAQKPIAWRVKWPAIGGGYKWMMVDSPLMEKEGFVNEALYGKAQALAEQPAQQEPAALKWQQAPVKTQWGDEMVVASVAIDKDHTVCLYCEREQTPKVEAMFAQRTWVGLTEREVELIDGMIEVQLHHAAQCDRIINRTMAEKQKGWDMERVELLRRLKERNQ